MAEVNWNGREKSGTARFFANHILWHAFGHGGAIVGGSIGARALQADQF